MELPSTSVLQQAINSTFTIESDVEISLLLSEINLSTSSDAENFENISMIFHSSKELGQSTYELSHKKLGSFHLFLVPVGKQQEQYQYEALINRQVE